MVSNKLANSNSISEQNFLSRDQNICISSTAYCFQITARHPINISCYASSAPLYACFYVVLLFLCYAYIPNLLFSSYAIIVYGSYFPHLNIRTLMTQQPSEIKMWCPIWYSRLTHTHTHKKTTKMLLVLALLTNLTRNVFITIS